MQLIEVNKARYKKHLNIVIVSAIAIFVAGSLGISQSLIALFPDESGSHFHWNLTGVIITAIFIAYILNKYRNHEFMTEVTYVWDLKQTLNKINRKMLKLKDAANKGDANALTALQFSYAGSRLLWQLDDNTIVMEELAIAQAELDSLAQKYQLNPKAENYEPSLLDKF